MLAGGKVEFEFEKEFHLGYSFRDLTGNANIIKFSKPKLLSQNIVEFFRTYIHIESKEKKAYCQGRYDYLDRGKLIELIYPIWDTLVKD
jgi:hypothetical protein